MGDIDRTTWLILGIAATGVVLLVLLRLAWRGRRMGEGQHWPAKCDYSLAGLPESSGRCPECGTEISLATGRNVRTGGRRRVTGGVIACLVLIGVAIACESAAVRGWLRRPADRKPTWLLLRDVKGTIAANRFTALGELRSREAVGQLSAGQRSRMIDAMLDVLKNANFLNWQDVQWLSKSRDAGYVSDAQWKRFYDDHPPVISIRPKVSSVEPFSVRLREPDICWMSGMSVRFRITSMAVNEHQLPLRQQGNGLPVDLAKAVPDLPAGRHELVVNVKAIDRERANETWTGRYSLPFDYVTDGSSTLQRDTSPAAAAALKSAIRPRLVRTDREPGNLSVKLSFPVNQPMCHDVYVKLGEGSEQVCQLEGDANVVGYSTGVKLASMKDDTKSATVILRPNPLAAAATPQLLRLVDAEVIYLDVPIEAPKKGDPDFPFRDVDH